MLASTLTPRLEMKCVVVTYSRLKKEEGYVGNEILAHVIMMQYLFTIGCCVPDLIVWGVEIFWDCHRHGKY